MTVQDSTDKKYSLPELPSNFEFQPNPLNSIIQKYNQLKEFLQPDNYGVNGCGVIEKEEYYAEIPIIKTELPLINYLSLHHKGYEEISPQNPNFGQDADYEFIKSLPPHLSDSKIQLSNLSELLKQLAPPIIAQEECEVYKQALIEAPTIIPVDDLDEIVEMMLATDYTMAYRELSPVVMSTSNQLPSYQRRRVKRLLEIGRTIGENTLLSPLFKQTVSDGYQIRVIQPGGSQDDLRSDLANVKLCWINQSNEHAARSMDQSRWLQNDTDLGACVQLIGEQVDSSSRIPKVYMRNYVAETKDGERMLFLDTIEGGNIAWSDPKSWIDQGRGKELLYHLAATICMAKTMQLKKIGLGEREFQNIASTFGYREETLFDTAQAYRKLGIQTDILKRIGPYNFQMYASTSRRVINIDEIYAPSLDELQVSVDQITQFMKTAKKTIKKNVSKREEVSLYVQAMEGINQTLYQNQGIQDSLDSIKSTIALY
ncbi:hypothetical protein HOC96_06755 [archaeon]|nr:hypothetical protein [archaeon]